ncbi:MAG: nucleotide sugar dehydrogenase, partial [Woeseiaceae bacterium]|nr:nucleotide sugar dehydrogenase [Woeseiaceae bacterium]
MASKIQKEKISVIGLGYVGLPLLFELSKKFEVVGFDISTKRISELKEGIDSTNELSGKAIAKVRPYLTSCVSDLKDSSVYIVTVPTPIYKNTSPNLKPVASACNLVGSVLQKNNLVIFESTVYPGLTEEFCVPILERSSKLTFKKEFVVGYSPERINPGDKVHTLTSITKIVSGCNSAALKRVNYIYSSIISAGTYKAPSIKVAEAAKVIENTQRDINIALVNELSKIFNLLEIDTNQVLDAACTKWNFHNFRPGLVGGHCIGVDPYYLTFKANQAGFNPQMILAGRQMNESMPRYIVNESIKHMKNKNLLANKSSVLVLGLTFKEDCPDVRNSKAIDLCNILEKSFLKVHAFDPLVDISSNKKALGLAQKIKILKTLPVSARYQLIIINSPHKEFKNSGA